MNPAIILLSIGWLGSHPRHVTMIDKLQTLVGTLKYCASEDTAYGEYEPENMVNCTTIVDVAYVIRYRNVWWINPHWQGAWSQTLLE